MDGWIDAEAFDQKAYYIAACRALEYTRAHLTTRALASYVLEAMEHKGALRVLLLTGKAVGQDYMQDMLVHGFRELLGPGAVEYPK
jgi:methylmalonyl-CoA mutase cobalamin-binding subunit